VKDSTGIAALYLGKQEGKELVYMGKVGTGWSRTVSSQIRKQLNTVISPRLTKPVRKPKATWSSRRSPLRWSTATSPPRACCGKARSRRLQRGINLHDSWRAKNELARPQK
jgi:ATP-dependent DNA ligase